MVGLISIANGSGRLLRRGCPTSLAAGTCSLALFLLQAVVFVALSRVEHFGALTALAFVVLLCYGGGFGTMPAFAADLFGPTNVGAVYGLMLTAWGVAGVVGPTLMARIRETTGDYGEALSLIAAVMFVAAIIPLLVRPSRPTSLMPPLPPHSALGRKA